MINLNMTNAFQYDHPERDKYQHISSQYDWTEHAKSDFYHSAKSHLNLHPYPHISLCEIISLVRSSRTCPFSSGPLMVFMYRVNMPRLTGAPDNAYVCILCFILNVQLDLIYAWSLYVVCEIQYHLERAQLNIYVIFTHAFCTISSETCSCWFDRWSLHMHSMPSWMSLCWLDVGSWCMRCWWYHLERAQVDLCSGLMWVLACHPD